MKYIKIHITKIDCENTEAYCLVFDCNMGLVSSMGIEYPTNSTKEDIKNMVDSNIVDYSLVCEHVGSRPNDR